MGLDQEDELMLSRRKFLKTSALGLIGLTGVFSFVPSSSALPKLLASYNYPKATVKSPLRMRKNDSVTLPIK